MRSQWRRVIDELGQGSEAEQRLAKQAQQHVSQMPAVEPREDALGREVAASRKPEKEAGKDNGVER